MFLFKNLVARQLSVNESFVFPNGVYIFRKDGTQIDPRSREGQIIVNIYAEQNAVRQLNREERLAWIKATFPKDPIKQQEYRTRFGV